MLTIQIDRKFTRLSIVNDVEREMAVQKFIN